MKLLKIFVAAILALAAALTGGCSDDDGIDNRDLDYGYVQFKLYKEASYDAVSRFVTLKIGDLLFTGTPAGVGPVSIGQHLQGYLEGEKLLDFYIR